MAQFSKQRTFIGVVIILGLMLVLAMTAGAQDDSGDDAGGETRPTSYTIQRGDTLDTIGQRYDVSVVAMQQANDLRPSAILRPGDTIVIPRDAPPYGTYPAIPERGVASESGGGAGGEIYVVQPRDTLDTIGQRLDVSSVSIQVANNITNSRALLPGMTLVIPADAPPYGVYPALSTNPGDSVASLGQGGGATGGPIDIEGDFYVIQPNDTLDRVAALHNVQMRCLADFNGIGNPRYVYPGDVIRIDRSCPAYDGYDFVGDL